MQLVEDLGNTLDAVDTGTGRSCVRMVPAEFPPRLHDVRSVMISWVWPVAVLTGQFFLSYKDGDDKKISPMTGGRMPLRLGLSVFCLPCSNMGLETILRNVARSSQLPDLQDFAGSNRFCNLSRIYVLDLCVLPKHSSIQPLGGGSVTPSDSRFESCGGEQPDSPEAVVWC